MGAARLDRYLTGAGEPLDAVGVSIVRPTIQLAIAAAVAAGGATVPVTAIPAGTYTLVALWSGAMTALVLEALGPDGATWIAVGTVTAAQPQDVQVGNNATLRFKNTGIGAMTGLSGSLS